MPGFCAACWRRPATRHYGAYRWHLARAEAVRDLGGQIVRWVGTTTDIDDQHAAREALTDLNLALKARVEQQIAQRDRAWRNSRDLQVIVGADGIIRAANDAWTAMLGWHPDEVVGRSHLDFSHPEHRQADGKALVNAGASVLAPYESRSLHKDGSYRWVSWASAPEGSMVYRWMWPMPDSTLTCCLVTMCGWPSATPAAA